MFTDAKISKKCDMVIGKFLFSYFPMTKFCFLDLIVCHVILIHASAEDDGLVFVGENLTLYMLLDST